MKTYKGRIFAFLIGILFVILSCGTYITNIALNSSTDKVVLNASTGPQIDYRSKSAGYDPVTGDGLQWFSKRFMHSFNLGALNERYYINNDPSNLDLVKLQRDLNEYSWWYIKGTNCLRAIALMLEAGASFEGITIHMTQNAITNTHGVYPIHLSIGTEANPFNGTFDGNGFRYEINSEIGAGPRGELVTGGIVPNADGYTGMFGVIKGATIMNLTVVSSKECFIGGSGQTIVGGIVAVASEDSTIINCTSNVDFSGLNADLYNFPVVGAIAGKVEDTAIINCFDFMNTVGVAGIPIVNEIGAGEDILDVLANCINAFEWGEFDDQEKLAFVQEMNNNMFHFLRADEVSSARYFWGISEGVPLFNSSNSLSYLDEKILFIELIYNSELGHINYFFEDTSDFLFEGVVTISPSVKAELDGIFNTYLNKYDRYTSSANEPGAAEWRAAYKGRWDNALAIQSIGSTYQWDASTTLENLYTIFVHEVDELLADVSDDLQNFSFFGFSTSITNISNNARDIFDEIYWVFAVQDALTFENSVKAFSKDMVNSSYNSNFGLITGSDKKSKDARAAMQARFTAFQEDWEDISIFDEQGEISNYMDFVIDLNEMMREAVYDFDAIYFEWAEKNMTPWVVLMGATVSVFIAATVILYLKLRSSKKAANIVYTGEMDLRGKKGRDIKEKADAILQLSEAQRSKSEAVAKLQREKAMLVEMARREITRREQEAKTSRDAERERLEKENAARMSVEREKELRMQREKDKELLLKLAQKAGQEVKGMQPAKVVEQGNAKKEESKKELVRKKDIADIDSYEDSYGDDRADG